MLNTNYILKLLSKRNCDKLWIPAGRFNSRGKMKKIDIYIYIINKHIIWANYIGFNQVEEWKIEDL